MINTIKAKYTEEFVLNKAKYTLFYDINKHNKKEGYNISPYKVQIKYPKDYKSPEKILNEKQKDINFTKRSYYHPETGDIIGYGRYMQFVSQGIVPHPEEI